MQDFPSYRNGQGSVEEKVGRYISDRQADPAMISWFAERALAEEYGPSPWAPDSPDHMRVLCAASCGNAACFRVVSAKTVREAMKHHDRTDPLGCPCHQVRAGFSCVHQMFLNVRVHEYTGPVIWEWGDCPGADANRMHWDVTLAVAEELLRIEIDNEYHMRPEPIRADIHKNAVVVECGTKLLRLHYEDVNLSNETICMFADSPPGAVYYSVSYEGLRRGIDLRHVLM